MAGVQTLTKDLYSPRRERRELVDYDALSRADGAFYELLDVELWPAVGRFIRSRLSAFFELTGR